MTRVAGNLDVPPGARPIQPPSLAQRRARHKTVDVDGVIPGGSAVCGRATAQG
ncbi:MAG: hypothetical protein LAP87_11945 [Acidobacteriia bacterium]|nr:hypothetical protein [Terriglobia bacterium]